MTTEDDFQKALNRCPSDWHTRLVFADWLDERGDQRGEGYRAMARLRRRPIRRVSARGFLWWLKDFAQPKGADDLPPEWFAELMKFFPDFDNGSASINFHDRFHAENMAALAWQRLPEAVKSKLLEGVA